MCFFFFYLNILGNCREVSVTALELQISWHIGKPGYTKAPIGQLRSGEKSEGQATWSWGAMGDGLPTGYSNPAPLLLYSWALPGPLREGPSRAISSLFSGPRNTLLKWKPLRKWRNLLPLSRKLLPLLFSLAQPPPPSPKRTSQQGFFFSTVPLGTPQLGFYILHRRWRSSPKSLLRKDLFEKESRRVAASVMGARVKDSLQGIAA